MNMHETLNLLEQIALIDDRVVKTNTTEQTAQLNLWAAILVHVPYEFAGQAVGAHYAESAWPLMPKDIAARWRKVASDRIGRAVDTFEPTEHPRIDPDDITGYQLALRAQRHAVRTGCVAPLAMRELMAGSDPVQAGTPTEAYRQARDVMRRARAEAAHVEVTAS